MSSLESGNFSLELVTQEIDKSPQLTLFFTRLTEPDSTFAKLFLLHQDELFLGDRPTKLPYFFWNNLPTGKVTPKKYGTVETFVQIEKIKSEQALKIIPGFLKFTKEGMSEEIKDLWMYIAITLARQNESIKNLITNETFSFRTMKEALRDYRDLNLDFPKKLPKSDEKILKQRAMRLAAPIIEDMRTGKLVGFLEKLPYLVPDVLMDFHVTEADQHLMKMLKVAGIEKNVYKEVLNELYSLGLIWNVHTIFWCENCRDQLQLLKTTSQFSPQLLKIPCPRCKKPMYVSSLFRVHDLLRRCIVSKDGLLTVALSWLLKKNDIECEFSAHNEYEYDFICKTSIGEILIECKMRRRPTSERSVRGALEKDVKQTAEHLMTLQKKSATLSKGYVVYNYDLEEFSPIVDDINKKFGNIEVIDQKDLEDLIRQIKSVNVKDRF